MSEKITFKIIKICVMTMDVALISITCGYEKFQAMTSTKYLKRISKHTPLIISPFALSVSLHFEFFILILN